MKKVAEQQAVDDIQNQINFNQLDESDQIISENNSDAFDSPDSFYNKIKLSR